MTTTQITSQKKFSSNLAFILSCAGSAIGLANIWKFPYVVGKFGGGSFLALYLFFLSLIGFPAFLSEILIGKSTQKAPSGAYFALGKTKVWKAFGQITIWTGFLISTFYSVVAGWILGYFFEALVGNLHSIQELETAKLHHTQLMESPLWGLSFHALFTAICYLFLTGGIRAGIERCNRFFMPLFFVILLVIATTSLTLPTATSVFQFFFSFHLEDLTGAAILVALGHAFFTLSVGQGTLVTYGSYLEKKSPVLSSAFWVVFADTAVSILSALSILSIVFWAGLEIEYGPGLIFQTLPAIFSQLTGGYYLSLGFFFLVFIAALTSQVSALEPLIAHFIEKRFFSRKKAVLIVVVSSYLLGIPSALSTNCLAGWTIIGHTFMDVANFITTSLLAPIGALFAVLLVGWRWGAKKALAQLEFTNADSASVKIFNSYFVVAVTFIAPILIIFVFLHATGFL